MTERAQIVAHLRHLARTASSGQARAAYEYAADEVEQRRDQRPATHSLSATTSDLHEPQAERSAST